MEDKQAIPLTPSPLILPVRKETNHTRKDNQEGDGCDDQEADLWWGAFAGRTLWPSFFLCGFVTLIIAGGGWYLWDVSRVSPQLVRYAAYWLAGVVWFIQLLRWSYCTVSINYRLTNRRLFRDRGFHSPAAGAIQLSRVTNVEVMPGRLLERLVKVGRIRVYSQDEKEPLVLDGVYRPEEAASIISQAVHRAKQGN